MSNVVRSISWRAEHALHPGQRLAPPGNHPRRCAKVREFLVKDEIVLVLPANTDEVCDEEARNRAVTLNRSGRAIWNLCDGVRSLGEIIQILASEFPAERKSIARHVQETVTHLSRLGFLDSPQIRLLPETGTTFVVGIEDKPYMLWQTAILLESFRDKLPAGWRTFVVICNNGEPISQELLDVLTQYETDYAHGTNYANTHPLDASDSDGSRLSALNRVEALSVAAPHVDERDLICILDSDIFLYGDINTDIMPTQCAVPRNWHIEKDRFFSTSVRNMDKGVDLQKVLEAIGCSRPFKPGGVNVFVTGKVAKDRKFIADCFRYAQSLYLLGRIAGVKDVWMAEMPCFALAMTAHGIEYDLLERTEFLVSSCQESSIPPGTLYHYYLDPADFGHAAFHGSKWHKQAYRWENFLRTDFTSFAANATTDHEKYFFQLAERARLRLYL